MINFNNIQFIRSYVKKPEDLSKLPQVIFVGKSNVGKSTLINEITGFKKLAFVSSKPGHTKLLNFYLVDKKFYLVDAPGYGYSKSNKFSFIEYSKIMDSYFNDNNDLKCVVLLIDGRREFSNDDNSMIEFLHHYKINYVILFTKVDKLNQKEKYAISKRIKENNLIDENTKIFCSNINSETNLLDFKDFLSSIL